MYLFVSAESNVYVDPVALAISTRFVPMLSSALCQKYVNDDGVGVHVPGEAVTVEPTTMLPLIDGATVLTSALEEEAGPG